MILKIEKSSLSPPRFIFLLLSALILTTPGEIFAQILPFRPYTVRDGLISNSINVFYQDSRGLLWIGTNEGVSVYDGRSFTNYTTANGLASNSVIAIIEDRISPGTIWFASFAGGLSRFSVEKFTTYHVGTPKESETIVTFKQDRTGAIWCGTENGKIFFIRNGSFDASPSDIRVPSAEFIEEIGDSLIWIGGSKGLFSYSLSSKQITEADIQYQGSRDVGSMCADTDGNLWVTMRQGVIFQVRGTRVVHQLHAAGWWPVLVSDHAGNLWAGSYGGLLKIPKTDFPNGSPVLYTTANGLLENTIRAGYVDRENNLWIGGNRRGLVKLSEDRIFKFPLEGINPANNLSFATQDHHNHIWIIEGGGVWEFMQDHKRIWQRFRHQFDFKRTRFDPSIFCDSKGRLWLQADSDGRIECYEVTPHSAYASTLRLVSRLRPGEDFPKGLPVTFMVDRKGRVWYSMFYVGLLLLDPNQSPPLLKIYGQSKGIPVNYVWNLYEDTHGNIWAGTYSSGLVYLPAREIDHGNFRPFPGTDSLADGSIFQVTEDSLSRIWVGTRRGGAVILENGKKHSITIRDGLPSNRVLSITDDANGNIWLGTQFGAVGLDRLTLTAFRRKAELEGYAILHGGLTNDGVLWFVTGEGLTVYEHVRHAPLPPPPLVHIKRFQVSGTNVDLDQELKFSHGQNSCVIEFVGVSFRDEAAVRYQYRMIGLDNDWQPLTKQASVTYGALMPGSYVFEVKSFNVDDLPSSQPAVLRFTIESPYWQRWWFIATCVVFTAGVIFGVYRYRLNKLLQIERLRLRIASDLHDDIGSSLSGIALTNEMIRKKQTIGKRERQQLFEASQSARATADALKDIVWVINPEHEKMSDLTLRLKDDASRILVGMEHTIQCDTDEKTAKLDLEFRRNVILIHKEALNNIVKHARANRVETSVRIQNNSFLLSIEDNGGGFDEASVQLGNGLNNLRRRAKEIGGTITIASTPGTGTRVLLEARIP